MKTTLIYITHPQVDLDPEIEISKCKISSEGWIAVDRLLKSNFWKGVKALYSSEETKAVQVAEKTSQTFGLRLRSLESLNELDRESTGLLPLEEYMDAVKFTYKNPEESFRGWETLQSSFERNTKTISNIMAGDTGKTVAIIGHGSAGTLIKCFIKGVSPSFKEDPQKTGCYFVADWDNKEIISDWQSY